MSTTEIARVSQFKVGIEFLSVSGLVLHVRLLLHSDIDQIEDIALEVQVLSRLQKTTVVQTLFLDCCCAAPMPQTPNISSKGVLHLVLVELSLDHIC